MCFFCMKVFNKGDLKTVKYYPNGEFKEESQGACNECRRVKPLSDKGLCASHYKHTTVLQCQSCNKGEQLQRCKTCRQTRSIFTNGECYFCYYNKRWVADSRGICKECLQVRSLDEHRYCIDCNLKKAVKSNPTLRICSCGEIIYKDLRTCPKCEKSFDAICHNCLEESVDRICGDCSYKCESCGRSYQQRDRCQVNCIECERIMDDGRCTICRNYSEVDGYGHCPACQVYKKPYMCRSCHKNEVGYPSYPCEECRTQYDNCNLCAGIKEVYKYECKDH